MTTPPPARRRPETAAHWHVQWLPSVASTNDELIAAASAGAVVGSVVATDNQTAGHGRLGREWVSPPGGGLAVSVLVGESLTPAGALPSKGGLLPLLAGLAVVDALADAGLHSQLKWPNDVLVSGRKVAGVLCRAVDSRVVVGVGVNTALTPEQLPVPTAGSLSMFGVSIAPQDLLSLLLHALDARLTQWREAGSAVLLQDYRQSCATIGQTVRVHLPAREFTADAVGVDDDGALVVVSDGEAVTVSAGDVIHLREGE
ncbi:MAG: biotin--[acetyl-CoA-carboxylase] ligase [Actinomycetales bacterium]|nr:biotin--[acetyl-CoA-carboxylase] ligase [Actinomycetales bacterium]